MERHLTWDHFEETFIRPAVPALHPIGDWPAVFLFVDYQATRIGIRCVLDGPLRIPARLLPSEIKISEVAAHDLRFVELAVTDRRLYKAFYSLVVDISDRFQVQKLQVIDAIAAAVSDWKRLLRVDVEMSLERALGLWGELWFVDLLIERLGSSAFRAWVGPHGEAHDFRMGDVEVEIKTTLAHTRSHLFRGADQLDASIGHRLFLLSLQLMRAGAGGRSVADLRSRITGRLSEPSAMNAFDENLQRVGYDEESPFIHETFGFRTPPAIAMIDADFPRVSAAALLSQFAVAAGRIGEVRYRLDVTGLVADEGSATYDLAFHELLAAMGGGDQCSNV